MPQKIFLTGTPGVGKTTVIKRFLTLWGTKASGFITEEIREGNIRKGFVIRTLDGIVAPLASVDNTEAEHKVGKYGIYVENIADVAAGSLLKSGFDELVIVDEVGKMECLSREFRQAIRKIVEGPYKVLGTIAKKGNSFIEKLKKHPGLMIIEVTRENRDELPVRLNELLSKG